MNPRSRRKNLITLTQFFDGGAGGGGGEGAAAAATVPTPFNAREHLADDGSFKPGWGKAAGVSEEVEKKFTRPEALARSYEQQGKLIGAKGIIVPGPNATQSEKDAYYTALGRPAKPEEYGFAKPATIKVGDKEVPVPDVAWDAKRAQAWQAKLHEMGVPKDQAQRIMSAALEESVTGLASIQESQAQMLAGSKAALQKEWGADYDKNMGAAIRAAETFGGAELRNHPALGNDPVLIKALAKAGAAIAERPGAGTRQQAGNDSMSAAEASTAAAKLTQDINARSKADRNWNQTAEAKQMKAEKSRLFQLANPER